MTVIWQTYFIDKIYSNRKHSIEIDADLYITKISRHLTVRGPTQEIPQEGPEYEGCLEEAKTNQLVPLGNET